MIMDVTALEIWQKTSKQDNKSSNGNIYDIKKR